MVTTKHEGKIAALNETEASRRTVALSVQTVLTLCLQHRVMILLHLHDGISGTVCERDTAGDLFLLF